MNTKEHELLNLISDIQTMRDEEIELDKEVRTKEADYEDAKGALIDIRYDIKDKQLRLDDLIEELTGGEFKDVE